MGRSKDAFFFPHDSNAHRDPKIIRLLKDHDWYGYGLYWAIIEMLRDAAGYRMRLQCDVYAFAFRAHSEKIEEIIKNYDLFEIDGDYFHSPSLTRRMEAKDKKSAKARTSAAARWGKNANAMRTQCDGNAKEKKRREDIKENKEKKTYGVCQNVHLSEAEYEKLQERFPDTFTERVDRLSEYIASKGRKYKSHYATILSWARKDGDNSTSSTKTCETCDHEKRGLCSSEHKATKVNQDTGICGGWARIA